MVGGNDVVGVGSLSIVNQEMTTFLQDVRPYSNRIVLMPAGRVGDAPFFPAVAAPFINSRAAALRNYFMATAAAAGVQYVDLAGPVSDTFATDPAKYYAADMFHPSSTGYALWFAALKQTLSLQ
jgi:lysophospholipase L1-like esterase